MAYEGPLGRVPPSDHRHLLRYSLMPLTMPIIATPVVLGINWYSGFDRPILRGSAYWLPAPAAIGTVRGGHAICAKPPSLIDLMAWWRFYDQGKEGACVGFAISRMMTILNRNRYSGFTLYTEAKKIDEWHGENYSGTSVRAGCDVARDQGMWRIVRGLPNGPHPGEGIEENRWATGVEEVAACLDPASGGARVLNAGYISLLNSWGEHYPHYVRMPLETLERVLSEDGEATVVTDRP